MGTLVRLTKELLEEALSKDPNVTQKNLGDMFHCGATTIARALRRFGLRTKDWEERKHSLESKVKMSQTHREKGLKRGDKNPNYGSKPRPWLEGDRHPLRQWHRNNPDFGAKQRGASNPVHKVKYLYDDPRYIARITSGLLAHAKEKSGKTYEQVYGPEKAKEYKIKLQVASPNRMSKFRRKVTEPERIVRKMLQRFGVEFVEQAPIGYYTVDFFVPSLNLVVQADGDYWHANPKTYPSNKLSKTQAKQTRIDASCDSFLRNLGYMVVRLWESDLHDNPGQCEQILRDHMRTQ